MADVILCGCLGSKHQPTNHFYFKLCVTATVSVQLHKTLGDNFFQVCFHLRIGTLMTQAYRQHDTNRDSSSLQPQRCTGPIGLVHIKLVTGLRLDMHNGTNRAPLHSPSSCDKKKKKKTALAQRCTCSNGSTMTRPGWITTYSEAPTVRGCARVCPTVWREHVHRQRNEPGGRAPRQADSVSDTPTTRQRLSHARFRGGRALRWPARAKNTPPAMAAWQPRLRNYTLCQLSRLSATVHDRTRRK